MELIQPLYDIVKNICTPISRRVGYGINLSNNFIELQRRVKELCNRRDDIKDQIELVKLQKGPTRECNGWLESVDEIEKKMIEEEQLATKRCFNGWFPDVIARVKLGKHVVDMIEQVKELQVKSRFEGGFVTDLPPKIVEKRPVDTLIMGTSTNLTLERIVDSIRDEGVQKIGIWGMGGVGKTTLMNLLNNMPEIQTMFQIVIWATVSKSWSIRKIQDEVAKRLSLPDVKDESDDRVSTMLFEKLEGKKFLLLLDDVWEWVDLIKVGIPSTSQENGCKIVLTSRDINVCGRMKTDVNIKVEVLDKKEAWELFMSQAGEISLLPTIKPTAEEIVRKCGGLPLALRVAGRALRMAKDVRVWRNFLKRLNSPDMPYIEDMYKDVFKPLKASYEELKDPSIKNCFLYCGLYPEDAEIKISRLITYWRAEGFLSKGSLEDAYDDGVAKLHDVIGASLLEQCEDENHVKMHDVVRDLVLKMTATGGEESRFMVRAGLSVQEKTNDKEWEEASRISFINAEGYNLPKMPNCPKLSTLLLQSSSHSVFFPNETIPECFFNHMPNLRVLDLSGSGIRSLPSSISNLVNLEALLLKRCSWLLAFPQEVSALQRLEVLHVSFRRLVRFHLYELSPIWNLTNLISLKFSPLVTEVCKEEMVPSVTISRLSLLEELSIKYITRDGSETIAKEVSCLTQLSSLTLNLRTSNSLKHFLHNSQPWRDGTLKKFIFTISNPSRDFSEKYERCLIFDASDEVVLSEINEVLIRSEYFHLENYETLGILSSDLGTEKVHGLKCFTVDDCALEYIVDEDGLRGDAFANLEFLRLYIIRDLRSICDRLPMQLSNSSNSFTKLKKLYINSCNQMKKVFSWGLIPQFLNLELLDIFYCTSLEEIVSADFHEEDNNMLEHVKLPKLKFLRLQGMPEFIGISKSNHLYLDWPSLEEVTAHDCPKLKIFPFDIHNAPNLRKINGKQQWWEALKLKDDATKSRFNPLFYEIS